VRAEQIETFDIEDMAIKLKIWAPLLWSLLGHLLSSDPSRERHRAEYVMNGNPNSVVNILWDEEDEYWAQLEE